MAPNTTAKRKHKPTPKHTPLKKPPALRQPPRCKQCSDRPLRNECIHTAKGRKFLESLAKDQTSRGGSSSEEEQIGITSEMQNFNSDPFEFQSQNNSYTESQPVQYGFSTPARESISPDIATPTQITSAQPQPVIDPLLMNQSMPVPSTPAHRSSSVIESEAGISSIPSTPTMGHNATSGGSNRLRISQKSAPFGFVSGVKRGNQEYLIPSPKALRPKLTKVSDVSSRFNREIQGLISRACQCERLSEECDLWMMIAVQQPTGSSMATHYTSPRLRKDAIVDTAHILNQFQSLTSSLLAAKHSEALQIAKELQAVVAEKESIQEETRKVLADKDAEIIAHASVIADLQAKIQQLEGGEGR